MTHDDDYFACPPGCRVGEALDGLSTGRTTYLVHGHRTTSAAT